MKLLVTGGSGFIGSNFVLYWIDKYPEDQIINLDKLTYAGNPDNLKGIENNQNYRFVKGDICDKNLVDSLIKEVDLVVHFAAESHVDRSIHDSAPFIQTNIVGTHVLLESSLKYKIKRFHHISTDEVFGELPLASKEKFNEKTPYNPRSPYAASKAASDHLVRVFNITYGLPVTISNCSNNFGPYQFPEKLISLTITNILEGKKVPIYGNGKQIRDWLYVTDHITAIDLILKKGRIGETYFIGASGNDVSNIDVIKQILSMMGETLKQIEFVKDRPGHDRRYAIDWSKIKRDLGWQPQYNFTQALSTTVDWYKKNTDWWQKIKSGEFKEYYQMQYKD
ncbi:dTDP-glucose 4,6-dehydratase [Candidatus Roizmanbacteria bacterium RIFCSPHIGHO2_02_FULL_37_13b]|uniref:dTDP-glucose 4,6-dehydratase n=1 Tax=Candidatus Roizmanbacteria bacterium RIFCSPLOWO2_02_FULL_36_11 TaxID=1802071 RepID=A0A1F7JI86_9BACT|nr:MAG: dTDP-glucose 4,6-dehydratase [Candidatus Roizmanbacteria bacterium RIFCSPHIGHO2_02_FULL_37_13b]OGK55324.1 MAG: dTDP-glucose 4,6-dehydratase [Candidatus Roizmanbacteria bacterium RIFCSPLOWO2_02_FULL_36_11]